MSSILQPMLRRVFARLPSGVQQALKSGREERAIRLRHRAACAQLVRAAEELSAGSLAGIASRADWTARRPVVRRQLLDMLGLEPLPERTALNARITGVVEHADYRIEKLVYESLPGLFVAANFYLPKRRSGPVPCVLYLNAHWPAPEGSKTGVQDRFLWYPAHGFALLVKDPVGFGEISGVHPGLNRLNWWHWLSLGYTPAGVEVWNGMRALDWLATRPEVDMARVGATGMSGGGVMTQFLAALDERVAAAAPSCSTYTIGTQAAMDLVPHQCDCTFYPNVHRVDFPEVLALIAPRPLLIQGGRKDPIFPPEGFRAAVRQAGRIYDLLAGPETPGARLRLVESGEGHADPPRFLQETRQWMCRWLRGREESMDVLSAPSPAPERPEALQCLSEAPAGALNAHVHDVWIRRAEPGFPASPEEWGARREKVLHALSSQVLGWFPRRDIPFRSRRLAVSGGYVTALADFAAYEIDSEEGVPVRVDLLTPRAGARAWPLIVWVKEAADHVAFPDLDEFLPVLRTHAVAILTPRFADRPLTGGEHARVERTAALTGRSIAALRIWDVLRTVDWVVRDRGCAPSGISVYGSGDAAASGLYAALLEPAIGQVILRDPPSSHLEGAALPLILRTTDIDEAAALLAPRRLDLVGARRGGFERARAIYDWTGASAAFRRTASLAAALEPGAKGSAGGPEHG